MQRTGAASVAAAGRHLAEIDRGLVILLGVGTDDTPGDADKLARKCARLRIFEDEQGRMGRSLLDLNGAVGALCISQFTLYGDTRRGLRPSFGAAAPPEVAEPLFDRFCDALTGAGVVVGRGEFGAMMEVSLVNDGPVTLLLET